MPRSPSSKGWRDWFRQPITHYQIASILKYRGDLAAAKEFEITLPESAAGRAASNYTDCTVNCSGGRFCNQLIFQDLKKQQECRCSRGY
jgi:hypothetical protein